MIGLVNYLCFYLIIINLTISLVINRIILKKKEFIIGLFKLSL